MQKITQEYVKKILHYDPLTGVFLWLGNKKYVKSGRVAGSTDTYGYNQIKINGKLYLSHRLAWLYQEGYWPEDQIDHKNKERSDNRFVNLRVVSRQCNIRNGKVKSSNKSGVTGVSFEKNCKKWRAHICGLRSKVCNSFDDAVKFRWELEKEYKFPNCQTSSSAYLYLKENNLI